MDVPADILLVRQLLQVLVHLVKNIGLAQARDEARNVDMVERLRLGLLGRVVDQDRVGLVPASSELCVGMRSDNALIAPDSLEALVTLDAPVIGVRRQVEAVSVPDGDDALAHIGGKQLIAHGLYVARLCGGPDDNCEVVDAGADELLGPGASREACGFLGRLGSVEEGAVEIEDDEEVLPGGGRHDGEVGLGDVLGHGDRDHFRVLA